MNKKLITFPLIVIVLTAGIAGLYYQNRFVTFRFKAKSIENGTLSVGVVSQRGDQKRLSLKSSTFNIVVEDETVRIHFAEPVTLENKLLNLEQDFAYILDDIEPFISVELDRRSGKLTSLESQTFRRQLEENYNRVSVNYISSAKKTFEELLENGSLESEAVEDSKYLWNLMIAEWVGNRLRKEGAYTFEYKMNNPLISKKPISVLNVLRVLQGKRPSFFKKTITAIQIIDTIENDDLFDALKESYGIDKERFKKLGCKSIRTTTVYTHARTLLPQRVLIETELVLPDYEAKDAMEMLFTYPGS